MTCVSNIAAIKALIRDRESCSVTLTLFYISYSIFEVPSNYCLKRLHPSVRGAFLAKRQSAVSLKELADTSQRWMAFLLFSWGAITIGSSGVTNFTSLAVTRFLLGIFEAGKIPNQYLNEMLLLTSLILIVCYH